MSALNLCRERVPELLHLPLQRGRVGLRIGDELLQEALHAVRAGEVRPRVAVEVLGDLAGCAHDLLRLLLQWRVSGVAGVICRWDRTRRLLEEKTLRRALGHELEECRRLA